MEKIQNRFGFFQRCLERENLSVAIRLGVKLTSAGAFESKVVYIHDDDKNVSLQPARFIAPKGTAPVVMPHQRFAPGAELTTTRDGA